MTLIGTENDFCSVCLCHFKLEHKSHFLRGFCGFLGFMIFFYPSFMHSAKLNQNKLGGKSDSLKQIYYFIPSLDRNFHQGDKGRTFYSAFAC